MHIECLAPSAEPGPRTDVRIDRVTPRHRAVFGSALRIKERAGTTLVTSVGKFASIPGFVFTFATGPRAATLAIGGVVEKPRAYEGAIALRQIQSLSIMIDHDLVDGGPAARFGRRLVDRIERAEGLAA